MCFRGAARCFDCEEAANRAILDGAIHAGDVVVIRYEGPKGGPGMREMYTAMKLIYGCGLARKTALVTDGRFSGTNSGCFVGHVSPEAAEGGPLAIVEDGDTITVDIPRRRLHLHLSDAEIQARLSRWQRPPRKSATAIWRFTRVWPSRPIKARSSGTGSSSARPADACGNPHLGVESRKCLRSNPTRGTRTGPPPVA